MISLNLQEAMLYTPKRVTNRVNLNKFNMLEASTKTTGRNDRTWSYAVFAEKHYPDNWQDRVVKYNPIFN